MRDYTVKGVRCGLRGNCALLLILKAETFSARYGVLIKADTGLQIALGLVEAVHAGEEPGSTGIGLLQTRTSSISGAQRLCISLNRLFRALCTLFRESKPIVAHTEVGLSCHTALQRLPGLVERALLQAMYEGWTVLVRNMSHL